MPVKDFLRSFLERPALNRFERGRKLRTYKPSHLIPKCSNE